MDGGKGREEERGETTPTTTGIWMMSVVILGGSWFFPFPGLEERRTHLF